MRADDGPYAALQEQDGVVHLAQRLLEAPHVLRAVGARHHHALAGNALRHALLVVLGQLLDALLAAARHAGQRQLAVRRDGEHGLHVQLRARIGHRARDAPAAPQRLKVLHHELGVNEVAGLLGPLGQLARRQALVALAQRLVHQQPLGHRGQVRVHQVELRIGVLGHDLAVHEHGRVEAAGEPAREAQVHGGHAALDGSLEGCAEHRHGHLGRGWLLAIAHGLVEVVGARCAVQVVGMLPVAHDVGELDELHPVAVDCLERQVAARVDDEVAGMRHRGVGLLVEYGFVHRAGRRAHDVHRRACTGAVSLPASALAHS